MVNRVRAHPGVCVRAVQDVHLGGDVGIGDIAGVHVAISCTATDVELVFGLVVMFLRPSECSRWDRTTVGMGDERSPTELDRNLAGIAGLGALMTWSSGSRQVGTCKGGSPPILLIVK